MQLNPAPKPITVGDDEILAALADIETPPLLAAVATLTGDLSILSADLQPSAAESFDPDRRDHPRAGDPGPRARRRGPGPVPRRRGCRPAPPPEPAAVRRMLEFLAGGPVDDDYIALMTEELGLDGVDHRAPGMASRRRRP